MHRCLANTAFPSPVEKINFASCNHIRLGLNTRHQRGGAGNDAPAGTGNW